MKRRDNSKEAIQKRITKANEQRVEAARLKLEYDTAYRKSGYFKTTLVIRCMLIAFCLYIFILDKIFFYTKAEVVTSCKVEKEIIRPASKGRGAQEKATYALITTTEGNKYNASLEPKGNERTFNVGDTIVVQHTIVHKPSYIANAHGRFYFPTKAHAFFKPLFLFLAFVLIVSLFMRSGYDTASKSFVRFSTIAGIAILLFYLVV